MTFVQLLNGRPLEDGLPTLAEMTAALMRAAWDYEAVAPTVPLTAGADRIYLSHAPMALSLTGMRINAAGAAAAPITVQVYAGGLALFDGELTVTAETQAVPLELIAPARRTLSAGARLEVRVVSAPGGYVPWFGLRICFLGRAATGSPAPAPVPEGGDYLAPDGEPYHAPDGGFYLAPV